MAKKDKSDFPDKWLKKLPTGYTETAETMSTEELQGEILKAEGTSADLEKDMENDQKLQSLKEDLKGLMEGYKGVLSMEKAKTKYCLHLLRLRGVR